MSDRWYSLTIASSQLQSLADALNFAVEHSDTERLNEAAVGASEAILRQVHRHIRNEKTITEWEQDFNE